MMQEAFDKIYGGFSDKSDVEKLLLIVGAPFILAYLACTAGIIDGIIKKL